jgi:Tol biopolymer transport system component
MGEVYRANDTKLHRDVAIKVLPDSFAHDADRMARFEREAHVLASLNHPNIASIYGVEDRALVMELVEGDMLHGPMPVEEALPVIHQLIDALEYAHEKGVIHRDLKPANIKLTPEGRLKVLDFGLAKALSDEPTPSGDANVSPTLTMRATMAGTILGTAAYMAPEQARGANVDKRADIWAFGVVVYELVTGKPLFQGPSISDTLAAVLKEAPDFQPVPERLRKLLRLCLEKDPRRRLRDIGDARTLLESDAAPATSEAGRVAIFWPVLAVAGILATAALGVRHLTESERPAPQVRFSIPLPDNKTSFNGHVAVSPDGKHVAFAAASEDGRSLIWIHDLDRLDSRPLSGTDDGGYFFWSPDSRSLAFWAAGKMQRVDVAGGAVLNICETLVALNGAWSSDGTIIFGTTERGLFRVPASGGTPVPISHPDPQSELNHSHPIFLRDGKHLLYHAESFRYGEGGIRVAAFRPDGELEPGKNVVQSQTAARYVPGPNRTGQLLFIRGETLFAQAFDESRLEVTGEARPLADRAGSFLARPFFGVSQTGVLAYWAGTGVSRSLVWFDRNGNRIGRAIEGSLSELAISPAGDRVAVGQRRPGAMNLEIGVVDLKTGSTIQVAADPTGVGAPVWSPDGKRLAFSTAGFHELHLKLSSGAGEEEKPVGLPQGVKIPSDWSRDGKYILFEGGSAAPNSDLWVLPLGGDTKPYLYLSHASSGRFSPDGHYVAYTSAETGRSEVYVQEFPPKGGKWGISTSGGAEPIWSADGREIFFSEGDQNLMSAKVSTAPSFQVSTPQRLFVANMLRAVRPGFYKYSVTRDGQRFLVNSVQPSPNGQLNVILNWNSGK